MIEIKQLEINDIDDYNNLKNMINSKYLHNKVIEEFKNRVGMRCNKIYIEYPYYDKDYLSTYYVYYSKKHKEFSKKGYRLHFFNNDSYCGYFSLRPTAYYTKIGKSYMSPEVLLKSKAYLILGNFEINLVGQQVMIKAFPWMYQETDIAVCAHVATWAIVRYYGNSYKNYADVRMSDIIDKTPEYMDRKIPSKGLNLLQIPEILKQYGFSPLIIQNNNKNNFYNELISYIESGIPLVGIMTSKQHAISILGHGKIEYNELQNKTGQEIIFNSELINTIIVNDDNYLPYIEITKNTMAPNSIVQYNIEDIDFAIVPLYDRMQLEYASVERRVLDYIKSGNFSNLNQKIVRIYITSSNSLKKKAFDSSNMNDELKQLLLRINMPKFVWCVDISSPDQYKNGLTSGRIIIDTTSCTYDENPWILLHDNSNIIYNDCGNWNNKSVSIAPYDIYINNLQEV